MPAGTPEPKALPPRSLERRVSASVLLVFLVSVPCVVVATFGLGLISARASLSRDRARLDSYLAAALAPALWDLDQERVEEIGKSLASDWGLAVLRISDDRRVLFSFESAGNGFPLVGSERTLRMERLGVFIGAAAYRPAYREYLRLAIESTLVVGLALTAMLGAVIAVLRKAIMHELKGPIEDISALVSAFGSGDAPDPSAALLRYVEFEGLRELLFRMGGTIRAQIAQLEASLQERNELTREINHRVRNNLQLLAAIVDQQAETSLEDKRDLRKLLGRIEAISYAYDQLWSAKRLNGVRMDEYLGSIARTVAFSPRFTGIRMLASIDPLYFSLDYAMSCGLLAYELIANAAEHAYGPEGGTIEVGLRRDGDSTVLTVEDAGKGCREAFAASPSEGLGFRFIAALADQLDAELSVSGSDGCRVSVVFPSAAAESGSGKDLFSS